MHNVEEEGHSVDYFICRHFSEYYLKSALPQIEEHYRDVKHFYPPNQFVIVGKEGTFNLVLRLVLEVVQFVGL